MFSKETHITRSQTERTNWIDSMKGIGILLVMAAHIELPYLIDKPWIFAGYIAMFFVVSGFTLPANEGITKGLTKKWKRLLIPYIVYGTIGILETCFAHGTGGTWKEMTGLAYSRYCIYPVDMSGNTKLLGINSPMWFLTAMFTAFMLTYIYNDISRKTGRIIYVTILAMAATGLYWSPVLLPWSLDTAPLFSILIISGRHLKNWWDANKETISQRNIVVGMLAIAALYLTLVYINGPINLSVRIYGDYNIGSMALTYIIGITYTILLGAISIGIDKTILGTAAAWIGKMSLRLMCIHMIVFDALHSLGIGGAYIYIPTAIGINWIIGKTATKLKLRWI
ncbi:MAG: acyltransferase family protein [Bacteroidales bacterium]|nr:acyltransferase family protein [Bacteroidales bacterium]